MNEPRYTDSLDGITPDDLRGFFVGWPNPPSPETHLRILRSGVGGMTRAGGFIARNYGAQSGAV